MLSSENLDKASYFRIVFSKIRIEVVLHFKVSSDLAFPVCRPVRRSLHPKMKNLNVLSGFRLKADLH